MSGDRISERCRHLWAANAGSVRIWQVCVRCGEEQYVTTHEEQLAATLHYVFRDFHKAQERAGGSSDETQAQASDS